MGQNNSFSQADYARKPTFSGFLPGIAGVHGIPLWCYYVNRGQGIVSFGAQDKDHPIMEFYPAHTAYQTLAAQASGHLSAPKAAPMSRSVRHTKSRRLQWHRIPSS